MNRVHWNLCKITECGVIETVCVMGPCTEEEVRRDGLALLGRGPAWAYRSEGAFGFRAAFELEARP